MFAVNGQKSVVIQNVLDQKREEKEVRFFKDGQIRENYEKMVREVLEGKKEKGIKWTRVDNDWI